MAAKQAAVAELAEQRWHMLCVVLMAEEAAAAKQTARRWQRWCVARNAVNLPDVPSSVSSGGSDSCGYGRKLTDTDYEVAELLRHTNADAPAPHEPQDEEVVVQPGGPDDSVPDNAEDAEFDWRSYTMHRASFTLLLHFEKFIELQGGLKTMVQQPHQPHHGKHTSDT